MRMAAVKSTERRLRRRLTVAGAILVGLVGPFVTATAPVYAAGSQLYLSPASTTVNKGASFSVQVRVNAGDTAINAIQANFTYPASLLEFVSISGKDSSFQTEAPSSGGNGKVEIARGQIGGVKGDALFATVTFKTLAGSGTAKLEFAPGTETLRDDNNTNNLSGTTGATVTLKGDSVTAAPSPTPAGGGGSTTSGGSATAAPPEVSPSPTTPTPGTSTNTGDDTIKPATEPTVTTNSKYSTIKPLDDKSIQGESTGAKAVIISVSALLIIAAAVFGTIYFRRHHDIHLAPAVQGDLHGGAAGVADFGPPPSSLTPFPTPPANPAVLANPSASVGPTNGPVNDAPAVPAPTALDAAGLTAKTEGIASAPTGSNGDSVSTETPADPAATLGEIAGSLGGSVDLAPGSVAATDSKMPAASPPEEPAEPVTTETMVVPAVSPAPEEVPAPAVPANANTPATHPEPVAQAAPADVPILPPKPNIQPTSHGVILSPLDPSVPRPEPPTPAPRPKIAMPEAIRPEQASTVIRPVEPPKTPPPTA